MTTTNTCFACAAPRNGFARRYHSDAGFKMGAPAPPGPAMRGKALDLTLRTIAAQDAVARQSILHTAHYGAP